MGTGVAWLDYGRTGSWTCIFQSAATDIYKPPSLCAARSIHNSGDGTFTDVTERLVWEARDTMAGVAVGDFDSDVSRRDRLRQRHPLSQQRDGTLPTSP
jgi:hypothetical protein